MAPRLVWKTRGCTYDIQLWKKFSRTATCFDKCKTVGIHVEEWLHLHSKGCHVFLLKLSSQMALYESCLSWKIRAEFQGMIRLKHSWWAYLLLENLPVPPSPTSTSLKVGMSSPVAILGLNQISAILGTGITPLRAISKLFGDTNFTILCNQPTASNKK